MQLDPVQLERSGTCGNCATALGFFMDGAGQGTVDAGAVFDIINNIHRQETASRPWWAAGFEPSAATRVFDVALGFAGAVAAVPSEEKIPAFWYTSMWLSYPSDGLKDLAMRIVDPADDNDEKARKITRWVLRAFPYVTDGENYGFEELWAPPLLSLRKGGGDCEDGAFLIHSLLLHAGVPWERIRTYGGMVEAGAGAAGGGHAWTAYRRESDNEWVILDSSYYPNELPVDERPPMREEARYLDNFFYFNLFFWVNTDGIDRIHNPGAASVYGPGGELRMRLDTGGRLIRGYA